MHEFKFPNTKDFVNLVETLLDEMKEELYSSPTDSVTDEAWIQAIEDCSYAVDLSVTAFEQHISKWYGVVLQDKSDREYVSAIEEILDRINKEMENYK